MNEQMTTALRLTEEAIGAAKSPCVLVSFGKDSLLLLYLARQVRPDVSIVWFKQRANKAQRQLAERVIKAWDLAVLSYAPAVSYFLPNNEGLTIIDEHSFSGAMLPVLTDTVEGTECAAHLLSEQTPFFAYDFNTTLIGWKATDEHFITGKNPFPKDGFQLGPTRLYAPLRDLTDEEVLQAIQDFNIPYEAIDDRLAVCTRCLQTAEPVICPEAKEMISPVAWQPQERLAEFRQAFL